MSGVVVAAMQPTQGDRQQRPASPSCSEISGVTLDELLPDAAPSVARATSPLEEGVTADESSFNSAQWSYVQEGQGEQKDDRPQYEPAVDTEIARMESTLDKWTYDLKRNVLVRHHLHIDSHFHFTFQAEFTQSRIKQLEATRGALLREKEKHGVDVNKLTNELEALRELLHTSVQRRTIKYK